MEEGRSIDPEHQPEMENTDVLTASKMKNFFIRSKVSPNGGGHVDAKLDMYDFTHPRRGLAVIINNKEFHNSSHHRRAGSEVDIIRLTKMFTCYGFDIIIYNDLTVDEMVATLKMVASFPDHAKADCFACVICSHGDEVALPGDRVCQDAIMGSDGDFVLTKVLVELFTDAKCPGLRGKPRLFFVQACRGDLLDDGQEIRVSRLPGSPEENRCEAVAKDGDVGTKGVNPSPLCAPIYPHFLVMYASPPGFSAWRRTDGTWFIRCLAEAFLTMSVDKLSLLKVLTRVSGAVARLQSTSGKKQVPCIVSKLTRDIYFTPKIK